MTIKLEMKVVISGKEYREEYFDILDENGNALDQIKYSIQKISERMEQSINNPVLIPAP